LDPKGKNKEDAGDTRSFTIFTLHRAAERGFGSQRKVVSGPTLKANRPKIFTPSRKDCLLQSWKSYIVQSTNNDTTEKDTNNMQYSRARAPFRTASTDSANVEGWSYEGTCGL